MTDLYRGDEVREAIRDGLRQGNDGAAWCSGYSSDQLDQTADELFDDMEPVTDERLSRGEWEATIDYRPLADALHHSLCKWNHTDGCAYYYHQWDDELPDWHPKHDWLKKAETVFDAAVKGET